MISLFEGRFVGELLVKSPVSDLRKQQTIIITYKCLS